MFQSHANAKPVWDQYSHLTETSSLNCSVKQLTGFNMMGTLVNLFI